MTYREVRRTLLDRLKITPQALNQQCQKLKRETPLTTEDATYIIAHRNGMKLDKYVDDETVGRIRDLYLKIAPIVSKAEIKEVKQVENGAIRKRPVRIGSDRKYEDVILANRKLKEASEMAKVFPSLYVLENSMREFIKMCMKNIHGENWWDTQAPRELREKVSGRMKDDVRDSWHQRRGFHQIDYLDMRELPRLFNKIQQHVVPDIIPNYDWFKQLVEEVYKSRCVVCHMNPLEENNIKSVEVKFNQWQKQMNDKIDKIILLKI